MTHDSTTTRGYRRNLYREMLADSVRSQLQIAANEVSVAESTDKW